MVLCRNAAVQIYSSADPLARPGDHVWDGAPVASVVVCFKLFRLLMSSNSRFAMELKSDWEIEWRYLLTSWHWHAALPISRWIADLLCRLLRRTQAIVGSGSLHVSRGLFRVATAMMQLCDGTDTCHACRRMRAILAKVWIRKSRFRMLDMLTSGSCFWSSLTARFQSFSLPWGAGDRVHSHHFWRLSVLPYSDM